MVRWHLAKETDFPLIVNNLISKEWAYVSLSSLLRIGLNQSSFTTNKWRMLVNQNSISEISCILKTKSGLILPALITKEILTTRLRRLLTTNYSTNTIMGLREEVLHIQNLLNFKATNIVEYILMSINQQSFKPSLKEPPDLCIKSARAIDTSKLFNLQKSYEIEEVILNPERFNSQMCYENLRSTLVKEIVLYGSINNIPVVKAGTNARGYNYDQIGGVFTDISQRHQGYATAVMIKLLKKIFSQDKSASLFVKPDNINAIKLYKTLGFVKKANFRIAYSYN